jgi:hypothetical protein
MLLASQPKDAPLLLPKGIDFTNRSIGCVGRKLTPAESTTVAQAIDSIGKPPPESLKVKINNRDTTVSCKDLADSLRNQLKRPGGIEGETGPRKGRARGTTKPDSTTSTGGDGLNISEDFLARVRANPNRLKHLEGLLIHEVVHKMQDTLTLRFDARREKEAYYVEMCYYDSLGLDDSDPPDPEWENARDKWEEMDTRESKEQRSVHYIGPALTHECFFKFDTTGGAASDSLITYELGDLFHFSYPFSPMRASDAIIFENYFLLPDSHCLGLVCGGVPFMNLARVLLLNIYHGEVVGIQGGFDYPGRFFYSITRSDETQLYFVLDTLNQQILTMADMTGDSIPETIISTYASAFWPGFEPLLNMRGVDAGSHPYLGAGLSVNHFDIHLGECIYPYDGVFFLPDNDGNRVADACLWVPMYEFLIFTPVIQHPLPWEGDMSVMLHATWDHDIGVWTTDPEGQIIMEPLGMIHMIEGIDAECMLLRPLMAGEFILAMDMNTGDRSGAIQVGSPIPQELTVFTEGPGWIHLRWEPVPGADYYAIYKSNEPFVFPPEPSYFTETNEIILPLADDMKFYRVTAVR